MRMNIKLFSNCELRYMYCITTTKLMELFHRLLENPSIFRRAKSIHISFSFQFPILTWLYSCYFELNNRFPDIKRKFCVTVFKLMECLNLWNPILINIKPDLFTTWKFHILHYFLLSLKITWLYSCEYE
jgi:hypothetical protein